jgi:predicted nucleic acid-binding protein
VNEVFADTFFFLALLSRDATARGRVEQVSSGIRKRTVVTGFVLMEVANALCARSHRRSYVALARRLTSSPHVVLVPASQDLLERGQALYASRPDKDWSLTDCTSFVVMQDRGITDVLTGDRHFEQAGFAALLK